MQSTSTTYKNLLNNINHTFDVRLNIGGTIYGEDAIFSAKASSRLFDTEPTIGGTYSNTFEFSVILPSGTNVARMATVVPQFRAEAGGTTSTWYTYGTYFIDTREVSQNDSGLTVLKAFCYDAMLKANADYGTSSLSWPATDTTVVGEIATKMGITVDSRTTALMNKGYTIPTVPIGYTLRDILSYIAVMYGGNWIITPANKLRLVPIAGGTDTLAVGKSAANLTVSPTRPAYTKLQVSVSEDTDAVIESGSSDDTVMTAVCPFITQAIVNTVFTSLSVFQYKPFTANGVWSDPAVELGDIVTINGFTAPVMAIDTSFGSGMVMELSAPNDNYIDHEYAYESPTSRSYKKTMGQMSTAIEQNEEAVRITAEKLSNIGGRNYAWAISPDYHPDLLRAQNCTYTYNPENNGEYVLTSQGGAAFPQIWHRGSSTTGYPVPDELKGTKVTWHCDYINASGADPSPRAYIGFRKNNADQYILSLNPEMLSYTFTVPSDCEQMYVLLRVRQNGTNINGETMTVRGLKLEKGEVATDWTPAPEDQTDYAAQTAAAQIVVASENILAEVSNTLEDYSTTTQMNAAINTSAQNITLDVSQTYQPKADAAVVNLVPAIYYRENASGTVWENNGITWTVNPDGTVTAEGTATANSDYYLASTTTTATIPRITLDPTKSYTYSGVPLVAGCQFRMGFWDAEGNGSTRYIEAVAYGTQAAGKVSCTPYLRIVSGTVIPSGGVTFKPMLETGTVAHGYVSTHNGSYAMQSQIVQNATDISLKVDETTITGNYVVGKINLSSTTATIEASHINLTGAVTISAFDSTTQAALLTGTTVKTQYYLSTSASSATGGTWYDSPNSITWSANHYVWTRVATTKTNASGTSSTTYSTAVYDKQLTSALSTAASAATAAGNAQTTANGTVTEAIPIYYRSMSSTTPTLVPGETYVYITDNTDDQWSAVAPRPKRGAYFWEAVRYTLGDGSRAYSTVRAWTSEQYASKWVSTADSSYIDGGAIYAHSVTADQIAANTITADRINMTDLFSQSITATNMNITGGSVNISTDSRSNDQVSLNYESGGITRSSRLSAYSGLRLSYSDSSYSDYTLVSHSGLHLGYNPDSSDYADYGKSFLIIGDRNAGRIYADMVSISIQDSSFTKLSELTNSGLVFRNASDVVTAQYPADNSTIRKASTGSATTMTTGTATRMVSIVLTPGVWVMSYMQGFANNATGYRTAYLTTNASSTSVSQSLHAAATTIMPVSGVTTYAHLTATTRVTAQTTVYGYAIQTSGGNLNGTGYINAVRIA